MPDDPCAQSLTTAAVTAGFEDFLTRELDGRPFVVIGDSQGAAMLNMLLARLVDDVLALRSRLVTAIILGGNVEVPDGRLVGGTFKHIPVCSRLGEAGCVTAYSSFPSTPPADSLFGRPGQGVSLQSEQTASQGLQVVFYTRPATATTSGTSAWPRTTWSAMSPRPRSHGTMTTPDPRKALVEGPSERLQADGEVWHDEGRGPSRPDRGPVAAEADDFAVGRVERLVPARVAAVPDPEGVRSWLERHLDRGMAFDGANGLVID
jgi:hypothetical protein